MAGVGGMYTIKVKGILDETTIRAQLASLGKKGLVFGGGKGAGGGFAAIGTEAKKSTRHVKQLGGAIGVANKQIRRGPKLAGGFRTIGVEAKKSASEVKKASRGMSGFAQSSLDVTKKVIQFGAITAVIRGVTSGIGSMVNQVFELDKSLTEFKKVSDLSGEGLKKYTDQAYELGVTVAKTGKEMIDASTEFRKSGYSDEDSMQLARVASMYQNVADQELTAGEAANFIISQMKAYNMEAREAEHVIDAVNEVSNNFAVSSADIATNIGKASAAMSTGNVTYEQSIGLIK